jgi:hypothetical protein
MVSATSYSSEPVMVNDLPGRYSDTFVSYLKLIMPFPRLRSWSGSANVTAAAVIYLAAFWKTMCKSILLWHSYTNCDKYSTSYSSGSITSKSIRTCLQQTASKSIRTCLGVILQFMHEGHSQTLFLGPQVMWSCIGTMPNHHLNLFSTYGCMHHGHWILNFC